MENTRLGGDAGTMAVNRHMVFSGQARDNKGLGRALLLYQCAS